MIASFAQFNLSLTLRYWKHLNYFCMTQSAKSQEKENGKKSVEEGEIGHCMGRRKSDFWILKTHRCKAQTRTLDLIYEGAWPDQELRRQHETTWENLLDDLVYWEPICFFGLTHTHFRLQMGAHAKNTTVSMHRKLDIREMVLPNMLGIFLHKSAFNDVSPTCSLKW